jgi:hypothetical protein
MSAKQPSPGATRRAKAFLSRYTALAAEDYHDALEALARLLVREYRRGFDEKDRVNLAERQTFDAGTRTVGTHLRYCSSGVTCVGCGAGVTSPLSFDVSSYPATFLKHKRECVNRGVLELVYHASDAVMSEVCACCTCQCLREKRPALAKRWTARRDAGTRAAS